MPIILVPLTSLHGLFSGILNKFKYDQFDPFFSYVIVIVSRDLICWKCFRYIDVMSRALSDLKAKYVRYDDKYVFAHRSLEQVFR